MQSNHTPGPWAVNAPDMTTVVWDLGGADVAIAQAIRTPANAALIAAAPELLDALQRVLRHIPADAGGASLSDDIHRARRAIARATGGA